MRRISCLLTIGIALAVGGRAQAQTVTTVSHGQRPIVMQPGPGQFCPTPVPHFPHRRRR